MDPEDFPLDAEECDECGAAEFVPDGRDQFGGTKTTGLCGACGYRRSPEDAAELAWSAEQDRAWERWSERD